MASDPQAGSSSDADDGIVQWLKKNGFPVTRQNWIEMNWPDGPPDPWTIEDELELPPELRVASPE